MMEERRIAIHETMLKNKREQKLMFMNPTGFDQKEKQYLESSSTCVINVLFDGGYIYGGAGFGGGSGYGGGGGPR
jgi:hypothetical protein